MAIKDFYKELHYDFSIYDGQKELMGLTNGGFTGTKPFCVDDFNNLELNAARDVVLSFLSPIESINKNYTSYGLKHIVERFLAIDTNNGINYISNGVLILAMYSCGYRIWRAKGDKNCFFNVSEKSVERLCNARMHL